MTTQMKAVLVAFMFATAIHSKDVEDQLFEMKAQIATLENEVAATKKLASQERANAFNPSISVVGDILGHYSFGGEEHHHGDGGEDEDHHHSLGNGVMIREVEFEFRADVDPYADALVALAVEPHGKHSHIHLEEAYARLKKLPFFGTAPLGLTIKLGQFRTAIGRVGRIHLHNIPQITYPMAMTSFLGNEGYAAPGLSLNFSVAPSSTTAFNFFAEGVFLSKSAMQDKGAEKMPSAVGHVWWHQELAPAHYLDVGASTLIGRKGKKGSGTFVLLGGDIHYSYMPAGYGQNPLFLFGSEFFAANNYANAIRWPMGNFTWAQVRLMGASFLGVRYDLAPQHEIKTDLQHAIGVYLSHYTSEFLRFRVGYEHVMPKIDSFAGDHRLMVSLLFVIGSHPMEPYFINR